MVIPGVDFKPAAYVNRKIVSFEESKVSIWDLGFLFGVSALEVIGVREGKLFKLNEHVDRLYDTARCLFIEIPMSKEETKEAIKETCRANEHRAGTVAIWVTAGVGTPWWPSSKKPSVIIFPVPSGALYPAEAYQNGISAITSNVIRPPPRSIDPQLKCSGSYVTSYLASMQAIDAGAQCAIMLDARGFVAEGPAENLFIVKNKKLITST
ncbi:MAG: aminotransferase class IV, partial [Candidatus Bathyarchaeia archaeon]